jgi:hypothetical protein
MSLPALQRFRLVARTGKDAKDKKDRDRSIHMYREKEEQYQRYARGSPVSAPVRASEAERNMTGKTRS